MIHGSLMYRDKRLAGTTPPPCEVIEHLNAPRLADSACPFRSARPKTIIVTTPNFEYNVKFETLPAEQFRHKTTASSGLGSNFSSGHTDL